MVQVIVSNPDLSISCCSSKLGISNAISYTCLLCIACLPQGVLVSVQKYVSVIAVLCAGPLSTSRMLQSVSTMITQQTQFLQACHLLCHLRGVQMCHVSVCRFEFAARDVAVLPALRLCDAVPQDLLPNAHAGDICSHDRLAPLMRFVQFCLDSAY